MCNNLTKGLAWATAMILIALGASAGMVEREAAQTMLFVTPALAVATMAKPRCGARA